METLKVVNQYFNIEENCEDCFILEFHSIEETKFFQQLHLVKTLAIKKTKQECLSLLKKINIDLR